MQRTGLQRPLTLHFNVRSIHQLKEVEVADSIKTVVNTGDVKAIQITQTECRITLKTPEAKQALKANGLNLRNMYVKPLDADKIIMNVTVKDAPFEMSDTVIVTALQAYGAVENGSVRRGKIKGTSIENGTRYLQMLNVEKEIPREHQIGRFKLRIFCDKNAAKRCFRCLSTDRMVSECPEDTVVCAYCGIPGHRRRECEEYQELELKLDQKLGTPPWGRGGNMQRPQQHTQQQQTDNSQQEGKKTDQLAQQQRQQQQQQQHLDNYQKHEEQVIPAEPAEEHVVMDDSFSGTPLWCPQKAGDPLQAADGGVNDETEKLPSEARSIHHNRLLLGASLIKHIDLGEDAKVIAKSGATAANVDHLLGMALEEVEANDIQHVIIHLGTNDAMQNKGDADAIRLNISDCINKVGHTFPEANLTVASIPPRKGKSAAIIGYNTLVSSINTYLQKLSERTDNLEFLDNTHIYMNNGNNINRRHYSDSDSSGVHLSKDGQRVFKQQFLNHMNPQTTQDRKRVRSSGSSTPNSAKKLPKQLRADPLSMDNECE